jgi:hypothetical protein
VIFQKKTFVLWQHVKQHNKRIHLYPQLLPTFYIKFGAALQFRKKEFKICSQILPKKNLGNYSFL